MLTIIYFPDSSSSWSMPLSRLNGYIQGENHGGLCLLHHVPSMLRNQMFASNSAGECFFTSVGFLFVCLFVFVFFNGALQMVFATFHHTQAWRPLNNVAMVGKSL